MNTLGISLSRPIVFFDLEATGTNVISDRIVEISLVKIMPDGERILRTKRVNPQMPIPPEATAIHKITDDMVKNEATFSEIARPLYEWLKDCDLGGYNILGYDIPLLVNEFKRANIHFPTDDRKIVDAFVIFKRMCPRDLTAAYKFYCGGDAFENAHSAEADILATVDVFAGQMKMYENIAEADLPKDVAAFPKTVDEVNEFCTQRPANWIDKGGKFKWSGNVAIVGFGANNGERLDDISRNNPKFLQWIIRSNFPEDTQQIARDALMGKYPQKES